MHELSKDLPAIEIGDLMGLFRYGRFADMPAQGGGCLLKGRV
jgi:hypothetical protein